MKKKPIPPRPGKAPEFALASLKIGQHISVPIEKWATLYRATQYHARKTGRKYACRTEGSIYTAWRVK